MTVQDSILDRLAERLGGNGERRNNFRRAN
jgi:hypothetical protein